MRIWNCCSDWCKNMENELSKESDSVGLFAYCKIKYLKLHLKWTIIPAEDVVLRRRHALITVGSGYGSDGNADRCIAVIARDTDCTGVTYTNPQVREAPGFSLQSAGFMWLRQPVGFEKNRKMRFKIAKNRNSNPRGYRAILVKRFIYKVLKYSSSTCTGVLYLSFS